MTKNVTFIEKMVKGGECLSQELKNGKLFLTTATIKLGSLNLGTVTILDWRILYCGASCLL